MDNLLVINRSWNSEVRITICCNYDDLLICYRLCNVSEIEKMRKDMEEEIRAQLEANMAVIGSNNETWEERVSFRDHTIIFDLLFYPTKYSKQNVF